MKIQYSNAASKDLEDIYLHGLLNFGGKQADSYAVTIKRGLEIIGFNPEIGRMDTRVNPAVRRFEIESHVVFYDVSDELVLVVRVLHKASDFVIQLMQ